MQAQIAKEEKNEAILKSGKKKRKLRHHMKKENDAVFKSGRSMEKCKFREKKMEFEENIKRQIIRKKKLKPNSSQEMLRRRASSEITRKKKMKPN